MNRTSEARIKWTKGIAALVLLSSISGFGAMAQAVSDKPLDAKSLASLVEELKGVVSTEARDEKAAKEVAAKWDARSDLTGKTKKAVINLLYQDVKSVIKDSGIQYQIYSTFSLYKQMPDESFAGQPEKTDRATPQGASDKPLDAESLAFLVKELKGIVSTEARDEKAANAVAAKWDARKDLTGKTKKAVINLLYEDVKSVIKDSGIRYQIYSTFSLYKQMPDESFSGKPEKTNGATPQGAADKPLDAKSLAALVEELKGVVSREAHDDKAAKAVADKWDARKDLTGKTKKAVINLLYADVKSVIKDSGIQYQIYSTFSLYKQMPDDSFSAQPQKQTSGSYSQDERHRLFQAVGTTRDNALIIEVAEKIGITDASGNPNSEFQSFVKEHMNWATSNSAWVLEHNDPTKAREYVMAHK